MALTTSSDNGAPIPLTVPTSQALSVRLGFGIYMSGIITELISQLYQDWMNYNSRPCPLIKFRPICRLVGSIIHCAVSTTVARFVLFSFIKSCSVNDVYDLAVKTIPLLTLGYPGLPSQISTGTLEAVKTETYGADTTYTFAAGTLTTRPLSKPDLR